MAAPFAPTPNPKLKDYPLLIVGDYILSLLSYFEKKK
jgi:hypothetical protein